MYTYISWMHFYKDFLILSLRPIRSHSPLSLFLYRHIFPFPFLVSPSHPYFVFHWAYNFRFQLHFPVVPYSSCAPNSLCVSLNAVEKFLNFSFYLTFGRSSVCCVLRSKQFRIKTFLFHSWICAASANTAWYAFACVGKQKTGFNAPIFFEQTINGFALIETMKPVRQPMFFSTTQIDDNWLKSKMVSDQMKLVRVKSSISHCSLIDVCACVRVCMPVEGNGERNSHFTQLNCFMVQTHSQS